jgi:hypothetical protein
MVVVFVLTIGFLFIASCCNAFYGGAKFRVNPFHRIHSQVGWRGSGLLKSRPQSVFMADPDMLPEVDPIRNEDEGEHQ